MPEEHGQHSEDDRRHDPGLTTHWGAAHLTEYLAGVQFPCRREDLYRHASARAAPEPVLRLILELPDKRYKNLRQVSRKTDRIED